MFYNIKNQAKEGLYLIRHVKDKTLCRGTTSTIA